MTVDELNKIFSIRDLWQKLGLPDVPPRPGQKVRSPLRPDKNPSFGIFEGGYKARDFSTGESFSAIDFFGAVQNLPNDQQIPAYQEWLAQLGVLTRDTRAPKTPGLSEIDQLAVPTSDQCRQIAEVRHLDAGAIALAASWGALRIGELFGQPSWILTDSSHLAAEARRMDGKLYEAVATLGERKAHSIRGTQKNWPVGLKLRNIQTTLITRAVLTEGGPDYLAAVELIFIWGNSDALPMTMLGAQSMIDTGAIALLANKQIRIIAHSDASKAGENGALRRQEQLSRAGCLDVRIVRLPEPYGDLNDFLSNADQVRKQGAANKLYGN